MAAKADSHEEEGGEDRGGSDRTVLCLLVPEKRDGADSYLLPVADDSHYLLHWHRYVISHRDTIWQRLTVVSFPSSLLLSTIHKLLRKSDSALLSEQIIQTILHKDVLLCRRQTQGQRDGLDYEAVEYDG